MRRKIVNRMVGLVATMVVALCLVFAMATSASGATGAELYKSKCSSCHGASGAGRAAIKGSNLLTEDVRKRTDEQLADAIANGGAGRKESHAYERKGLGKGEVGLLVRHVRELQKKSK